MNKLITTAFFLTLVCAANAFALPVDGILGRWVAQETILGRGVQFQLGVDFNEFTTDLTVKCFFNDGAYLEAKTSAQVNYDGNDIFIQETRQAVIDDRFHFCRATLQPSRWSAYFDGTGRIVLFVPVPYQARFTLIRNDF